MLNGLVLNVQKNFYFVKTEGGILQCTLKGKLYKEKENVNSPVVVGDYVLVEKSEYGRGIINEILPRKSKFSRKVAGSRSNEQILAANIDQVIITCSVKDPKYKLNTIERYIVAAHAGNIRPIICFNKVDLINFNEIEGELAQLQNHGYQVICTSTSTGEGVDVLKETLKNKISIFSGSSGVGKSSLINLIQEEKTALTGDVGNTTGKGRHTTTSTHLYELPFGGMILDSPGMREFALIDSEDGIKDSFAEIEELAKNCKFRGCSHSHEPKCAVKDALENGEIEERRYKNFLKLARSR